MRPLTDARRVLLVHAHPDDETLATGVLAAELVARGIELGLVTATRGEQGEVVPAVAATLPDDVVLNAIRERELTEAIQALGIGWHAYLGSAPARAAGLDDRQYADSGMRWIRPGLAGPADDVAADALTSAPLEDIAADIEAAIEQFGADAVVTYDDDGGYGHPDHLRCHEATLVAARAAGAPVWLIRNDGDADLTFDGAPHLAQVKRALGAHRTQLTVDGDEVVHSGGQREPIVVRAGVRPAR